MAQIRITPAALLGANDFAAQQRGPTLAATTPPWSFTADPTSGVGFFGGELYFSVGGTSRWQITAAGHIQAQADNTYDIGSLGALRPRDVFIGRNVAVGGIAALADGTAGAPSLTNTGDTNTGIYFPADEQVGITVTGAGRVIFTTSLLFPVTDTQIALGTGSFRFSDLHLSGAANIGGVLNHDGTTAGVYGVTPATRPTAFTQTYSTATKTHSNPTAAALTDNSGGTADTTLQSVPNASGDGGGVATVSAAANVATVTSVNTAITAIKNDFADLAASNNALIVDLANTKQVLNQVIDDLQITGWLQ